MHSNIDNSDFNSSIMRNEDYISQFDISQFSPVRNLEEGQVESLKVGDIDQIKPLCNSARPLNFDKNVDFSFPAFNPLSLTVSNSSTDMEQCKTSPSEHKSVYDIPKLKNTSQISKKKKEKSCISKKVSGDDKKCSNCYVTETPLWRRTPDRKNRVCNACGLYYKQYNKHRSVKHNQSINLASLTQFKDFDPSLPSHSPDFSRFSKYMSHPDSNSKALSIDTQKLNNNYGNNNHLSTDMGSTSALVRSSSIDLLNLNISEENAKFSESHANMRHRNELANNENSQTFNNNSYTLNNINHNLIRNNSQQMLYFNDPSSFSRYSSHQSVYSHNQVPSEKSTYSIDNSFETNAIKNSSETPSLHYPSSETFNPSMNSNFNDLALFNPLNSQNSIYELQSISSGYKTNPITFFQPESNLTISNNGFSPDTIQVNPYLQATNNLNQRFIDNSISITKNVSNSSLYNVCDKNSYNSNVTFITPSGLSVPESEFLASAGSSTPINEHFYHINNHNNISIQNPGVVANSTGFSHSPPSNFSSYNQQINVNLLHFSLNQPPSLPNSNSLS
ncbi:GATA zinc finger domain-containing protein [Smittium culicis]|uniref:GATA zinc finger domain-containing protein n=1 Tax=Smittium culicis TaxID=133412 RepID=A0A1R1X3F9_9FUNG|nr:GATA zinc finger domain-containing protein [Smittium culicis]